MSNPAIISDVATRWRPLTSAETITVTVWLDDAWEMLRVDSPGIEARMVSGAVTPALVVATLSEAVARKGRNADGKRQESITIDDATRSWTLDSAVSAGELYFTESELRRLSGEKADRPRARSVMPS